VRQLPINHLGQGNVAAVAIRVGHSADPDDAFMVWALEAGRVDKRGLTLEPVVSDIQTLNEWALEGRLEVTAISAGAYPSVAETYALLPHGASFGEGYGPIVVARRPLALDELRGLEIVTPGPLTTAARVLRLALGSAVRTRDLPFDEVLDEVTSGRAEAGLLIHEGQLTYADAGLEKVLDLGVWWQDERGLPLPLGLVAARRDLDRLEDISAVLREAIDAGLANRDEAMRYAMGFGRGIDAATADEFVAMYVNDLTLDMGERGRRAVTELLGHEPDFV
jgi:1,4-dihydroxy-6-naphthoate synthase